MTPAAFVRRPGRWIRELARKPGETGGVFSAAPNFAFEHAAMRGLPRDDEPPLDLSNVKGILNGSEPVSPGVDAQVLRSLRALRAEGDRDQAVLRPGRGDAVRLDHPDGREADGHPRGPGPAQQGSLRRGRRRCAERRRPGFRRQDRRRRVGGHRRRRIGQRVAGRADRRDLAARQQPGCRLLGQGRGDHRDSSGTSSSRGSASRTPRAPRTTACGCAPATTAPTTRDTSI